MLQPEPDSDHVTIPIDEDEKENEHKFEKDVEASEQDVFLSESTTDATVPNFNYPYNPHQDDLSCIPELPCSHTYVKVGKLYKCKTDYGLCNGRSLYVGACWPMMLLTQCLISGITLAALFAYGAHVHWLFVVGGLINMLVTVVALAKTSCTDPGIVERHEKSPDQTWRWNERGQSYYPPGRGITYCSESQILVEDYDHFCPWTGTTIAGGNMKWFTVFVSSLSLLCVVVIFITIIGSASVAVSNIPSN